MLKKSIAATALAAALITASAMPAFAAEITASEGSGTQTVKYSVGESFTVSIPADVTLQKGTPQTGSISVSNLKLADRSSVEVELTGTTNNFNVTNNGTNLAYEVKKEGSKVNAGETVATFTNEAQTAVNLSFELTGDDSAAAAGDYSDTITYTVELVNE